MIIKGRYGYTCLLNVIAKSILIKILPVARISKIIAIYLVTFQQAKCISIFFVFHLTVFMLSVHLQNTEWTAFDQTKALTVSYGILRMFLKAGKRENNALYAFCTSRSPGDTPWYALKWSDTLIWLVQRTSFITMSSVSNESHTYDKGITVAGDLLCSQFAHRHSKQYC